MVEAERVDYLLRAFVFGDIFRGIPDQFPEWPAIAVYVPPQRILTQADGGSGLISGPFHIVYKVLIGDPAQEAYANLLNSLEKAQPKRIEVPDSFVEWARATHTAQNPQENFQVY